VAVAGFLCLAGAGQNASATNYFNWDAESDKTSLGPILSYAGQTTRDCTVAHTGSCSMRLNVIGNDGANQQMGAEPGNFTYPIASLVGSRAIYYRWWMKIMSGFSWGAFDQKTKSSRLQSNGVPGGYTGYLNSTSFELGEAVQANSDPASRIFYTFRADSTWHEYVVMVKANTTPISTDGQFKAWVDGVLVGQQINNFRLTQDTVGPLVESWGGWMVRPYFQLRATASDGGTIYLDDFSTDDSWNSLIPGSPFNTLSPPGNLRVVN
jgi:hypothetical protein